MIRDKAKEIINQLKGGFINENVAANNLIQIYKYGRKTDESILLSTKGKRVEKILYLDGNKCFYCGRETFPPDGDKTTYNTTTIDHIIPISCGGLDHIDNCLISCSHCNFRKSNKLTPDSKKPFYFYLKRIATKKDRRIKFLKNSIENDLIKLEEKEEYYLDKFNLR